ncbi:MAG: hypothetical protein ABF969_11930 [Sporolactobacillus sp.]
MWVVWDAEDQIVITTDNKQEAIKVYEKDKANWKHASGYWDVVGEEEIGEKVILARLEKVLRMTLTKTGKEHEYNTAKFEEESF